MVSVRSAADLCLLLAASVPQGSKQAGLQHLSLGSNPILQRLPFFLSTLVVKLLCAQANLSFQQIDHQTLALASSAFTVHVSHPTIVLSSILDAQGVWNMNNVS